MVQTSADDRRSTKRRTLDPAHLLLATSGTGEHHALRRATLTCEGLVGGIFSRRHGCDGDGGPRRCSYRKPMQQAQADACQLSALRPQGRASEGMPI
jgi:hypothetical protein